VTPGQEALHEAMRVEQAKIYGTTVDEHHTGSSDERALQRANDRAAVEAANRRYNTRRRLRLVRTAA
jgi:hypothetical protein